MVHGRRPELAHELADEFVRPIDVLVGSDRGQEISGIGQAIGADRTQVGQAKVGSVVLADVPARAAVRHLEPETYAARDYDDLLGLGLDRTQLGDETVAAGLRHEQHLAVRVVEAAVLHRPVDDVKVRRTASLPARITVAGHRDDALDEIGRCLRHGQRVPAQLVGRRRLGGEIADDAPGAHPLERPVHRRGPDAVEPGASVVGTRRGERCTAQLLGV